MRKAAKPGGILRPVVIAVVVAEAAAFGVSFFFYRRLNRSQEYRHWMYQNFKPGLEVYYQAGEILGGSTTRTYDYSTWGVEN